MGVHCHSRSETAVVSKVREITFVLICFRIHLVQQSNKGRPEESNLLDRNTKKNKAIALPLA